MLKKYVVILINKSDVVMGSCQNEVLITTCHASICENNCDFLSKLFFVSIKLLCLTGCEKTIKAQIAFSSLYLWGVFILNFNP